MNDPKTSITSLMQNHLILILLRKIPFARLLRSDKLCCRTHCSTSGHQQQKKRSQIHSSYGEVREEWKDNSTRD